MKARQGDIDMKGIIVAMALSLAALGAQAQSIDGAPFIAVRGSASAEVAPDLFPLAVTLSETGKDAARSQAAIEALAARVVEEAQKLGLEDRDIDVSNLSVSPEYRYNERSDTETFLGNTYMRRVNLRFRSLADLKALIAALPQAEQVRLETGRFETSRARELRRELLERAVEDARRTAEAMAGAVGRRLGPVHNVSNQGFNARYSGLDDPGDLDRVVVTGARSQAPQVVLREGSIRVDQNVYVIYTLVD